MSENANNAMVVIQLFRILYRLIHFFVELVYKQRHKMEEQPPPPPNK